MNKQRIAIFASGTGSNYEAIVQAKDLPCEIVLLVCDQREALVIEKANKYGTPTFIFDANEYDDRETYEQEIVEKLKALNIEWIFLAGYMRLIGPTLLNEYEGRIVNIHPSLLPDFPGLDAIGQAFRAGVTETGVTIHYVDAGMDTGPIIAQQSVTVSENETMESLKIKIQAVEHELYPNVVEQLLKTTSSDSKSVRGERK